MEPNFDFRCDSHQVDNLNLSYLDSDQDKTPLHFYHANGFPISVYLPFLRMLTADFKVLGLGLRGQDAQVEGSTSWRSVADDLIDFLDAKQPGPVVGVGHSVGAVSTMFAAVRRPDLFSRIVLIDPVLLPWKYILAMMFITVIGRKDLFFLAKRSRKRQNGWKNREEAYAYLKTKPLFKRFQDEFVRSYVTYGLKPSENGAVELLCPPEAEARIFENYPFDIWFWPKRVRVPVLIIRGAHSDVLQAGAIDQFCRKCKNSTAITLADAGHLAPMEVPEQISELIKEFTRGGEFAPIQA